MGFKLLSSIWVLGFSESKLWIIEMLFSQFDRAFQAFVHTHIFTYFFPYTYVKNKIPLLNTSFIFLFFFLGNVTIFYFH